MANTPISEFLHNIRRAALRCDEVGLSDGQLLEAYVRNREEAAFAALVQRHGPMVWGVCRRALDNEGDAEDAFQATFLVLVRKADSVVPREQIANWLYGVAWQTAVKARAMAMRRKAREKQVKDMPEPAVPEQGSDDELLHLLDRELGRLPVKYRTAIVLCDLEGKSYKEAARQLGCPEGTLAARLARGRAMLAKRLARRGLAVTSGALATVLSQSAPASVPAGVVSSTIEAASAFAAGQAAATGVIAPTVAALTEGVLKTMLLTKLKLVSAAVLLVLLCFGSGVLIHGAFARSKTDPASIAARPKPESTENAKGEQPKAAEPEREKERQPLESRSRGNPKLQTLLKERLEILRKDVEGIKRLHKSHAVGQDVVRQASLRLYKAELDSCENTRDRITVLEKIADVYKEMEDQIAPFKKGAVAQDVIRDAKLNRLEAEIALEREKAKLAPPSK